MQTSAAVRRHRGRIGPDDLMFTAPCQRQVENNVYSPPPPYLRPRILIMVPIASAIVRCRLSSSLSMMDTGDNVFAFGLSGSTVRLRREPVTSRVTDSTCVCSATFWFFVGSKGTVPVAQAVRNTAPAQTAGTDTSFGILSIALTSLSTFPAYHWQNLFLPVTKRTCRATQKFSAAYAAARHYKRSPCPGACSFLHHRTPRRQVIHHCCKIACGRPAKVTIEAAPLDGQATSV